VSFIVPAWNEEVQLPGALEALKAAASALSLAWEIVVADDGSDDRTAEIARELGARVVSGHHRQIAAARNMGATAARGDLLIFVDADTRVTPEVVLAAVKAVRAGAVGGGCVVRFDEPLPRYARVMVPVFSALYRATGLAAGCFLFCTREAFERAGRFDERLFASEECRLSLALKRLGKFVILRETVLTSSRKLRTYSGREVCSLLFAIARNGIPRARDRKGMELWYGPRRADPA
jgi:glycosyltransferase involved in cell wall biosynthesis